MKLLQGDKTDEVQYCLWIQKAQSTAALQHCIYNCNNTKQSMPRDKVRLVIQPLVVEYNDKTCTPNYLPLYNSSQKHKTNMLLNTLSLFKLLTAGIIYPLHMKQT